MQNIEEIFEEVSNEFELDCVFEVASVRSPILKQIDAGFKDFLETQSRPELKKKLQKYIKAFTGIPKVEVTITNNTYDGCVFIVYNQLLPSIFKRKNDNVEVDRIKAEESPKYIKRIVVCFGTKLINMLTPKEMTSIVLHEIGHIYQHTSNVSMLLPRIVNKASQVGATGSSLLFLKVLFFSPINSAYILPFIVSLFTLSRTLTFGEHMGELDADRYAAKYGYGDELAKVFYKFNKRFGNNRKNPNTWIKKVWASIRGLFSFGSHPEDSKRICELIRMVKSDYKDKYPKLKSEISTIYAEIKC